jgi:hypothetical protein
VRVAVVDVDVEEVEGDPRCWYVEKLRNCAGSTREGSCGSDEVLFIAIPELPGVALDDV